MLRYIKTTFLWLAGIISAEIPERGTTIIEDIRLVGGEHPHEGRVEIKHKGQWGTICDDDWRLPAARVVCRMMGYTKAVTYVNSAYFGQGDENSPIWLDNVHCDGDEESLIDCRLKDVDPLKAFGDQDCKHHEDAGVVCSRDRIIGHDVVRQGKNENLKEALDVDWQNRLQVRLKPSYSDYLRKKFLKDQISPASAMDSAWDF